MAETKQIKAAAVLNNAFNSSFKGGDGVALCGTHPTKAGTLVNNVSVDVAEAAFEAATITINKWTDDRGLLINVKPVSLHIPVDIRFDVERILKSTLRPSVIVTSATATGAVGVAGTPTTGIVGATNSNEINALNSMGYFNTIREHRRFTDADGWFIKTDITDGLKHMVRRKVRVDTDGDFQSGNSMVKMSERYTFGWSDFRQIYGSAGA